MRPSLRALVLGGGALAAWGLWESQWLERREVEVDVPGLPAALDGFRVLHLSDLHLGTLSLGARVLARAVEWGNSRSPDLVCVTGDLVTHRGGRGTLERELGRLRARLGTVAVLGNHDVDDSRDPFRRPADIADLADARVTLLRDRETAFEDDGARIQVVGVHPGNYRAGRSRPAQRVDPDADLRLLLCHFPDVVRTLPPGAFHVVLAGHFHGGQICLPSPWGRLRLKDLRANYWEGLFETPAGALHVSRGLGTSFVPFRLLARPEATVLILRAAPGA